MDVISLAHSHTKTCQSLFHDFPSLALSAQLCAHCKCDSCADDQYGRMKGFLLCVVHTEGNTFVIPNRFWRTIAKKSAQNPRH